MRPMLAPQILSRPDEYWALRGLKAELKALRRERAHLERKQKERSLSPWEAARLEEILDETMSIMSALGDIKLKFAA